MHLIYICIYIHNIYVYIKNQKPKTSAIAENLNEKRSNGNLAG